MTRKTYIKPELRPQPSPWRSAIIVVMSLFAGIVVGSAAIALLLKGCTP